MSETTSNTSEDYRAGFRDGVGAVVRGLLFLEADAVDVGALIGALSRFERDVESWQHGESPTPPTWQPAQKELSVDE